MKLITAIVRPEVVPGCQKALAEAGIAGFTRWDVIGRGRQQGIKVGEVVYDELAKEMLYVVVADADKDAAVDVIIQSARTGEGGNSGDGRVFVTDIAESYTISQQAKDDEPGL